MKSIFVVSLIIMCGLVLAAGKNDGAIQTPEVETTGKIAIEPTPEEIHMEAQPGQPCSSCHSPSGLDAEIKPFNHFLTARECDKCHLNKSWIPLRNYSHLSGKYKPNSTPMECETCHVTNSEYLAK